MNAPAPPSSTKATKPRPLPSAPLWEQPQLAAVTGGPLRPGGIELTVTAFASLRLPEHARVLDAGCGNGATCARLSADLGFRMVGMDASHRQAGTTKQRGITCVQGVAQQLPYANATFDAVICECVLSLTPSIATTCLELTRVLKPSGFLILSDLYQKDTARQAPKAPRSSARQRTANASHFDPQTIFTGCACNAQPLDAIYGALETAHCVVRSFGEHTKALKELTAQLIFAGVFSQPPSGADKTALERGNEQAASRTLCCQPLTTEAKGLGYYQIIAQHLPSCEEE